VAYSSVSHLGFCVLALVAFNAQGIAGGLLHMVNHGLSTGALFLLVGFLLQRYTSGQIADFSGLWKKLPVFTFFMIVICLATIGLPGLNNFISEMLMLSGLFDIRNSRAAGMTLGVVAGLGIFLSAWYIMTMVQRVFFKELKEPLPLGNGEVKDLGARELAIIVPLTALCVLIGCCPQPVLDAMKRDVAILAQVADDARREHAPAPVILPTHSPKPDKDPRPAKNIAIPIKKADGPKEKKGLELLPMPKEAAPRIRG
jgi:NADH-quinone oxidoreductase subunit M